MLPENMPPLRRSAIILTAAAAATLLVWVTLKSPTALVLPSDLRDAPADFADLAQLHDRVGTKGSRCAWCHTEWQPGGGSLALKDSARWIASAAPTTAVPSVVRSHVCLSCHDNSLAVDREAATSRKLGFLSNDPASNHPIGVSYREVSLRQPKEYHHASSPNIRLEDGKVGCISCHVGHSRNGRIAGPAAITHGLCLDCHNLL